MTYKHFLGRFVGATGILESYGGSWNFVQREGGRDVLSKVYDGFVVVFKFGTDYNPENNICSIPLTLFTFNSNKTKSAGFL